MDQLAIRIVVAISAAVLAAIDRFLGQYIITYFNHRLKH
jgi:hypothetical protein